MAALSRLAIDTFRSQVCRLSPFPRRIADSVFSVADIQTVGHFTG